MVLLAYVSVRLLARASSEGLTGIEGVVDGWNFAAQFCQFLRQLFVVTEVAADCAVFPGLWRAKLDDLFRFEENFDGVSDVLRIGFLVILGGWILVHVDLFAFLTRCWQGVGVGKQVSASRPHLLMRFRRTAAYEGFW